MHSRNMKVIFACLIITLCYVAYAVSNKYGTPDVQDACDQDSCHDITGPNHAIAETDLPSQEVAKASIQEEKTDLDSEPINVLITFTNAENNWNFQQKFAVTIGSLFRFASRRIMLYIIGDPTSQQIAKKIIEQEVSDSRKYKLASLDVDQLGKDLEEIIRPMQDQFSYKPGAYYNHVLFFLSIPMHRILPHSIKRVIMLDADLKFKDDIVKLYDLFDSFTKDNVIGIARDGQPVYRHTFWQYRQQHPGTRVGEPPPDGLTGFNSGVLLLDLDKMRGSGLYNSLLTAESIKKLSTEFGFKGHLGDQDFFTLIGMKYEQLFFVLPCLWNRQLCQWWKDKGYEGVFDSYFRCDGEIKIYHGNCNTPIP